MILSHANRPPHRRGAILLVVMTLTALFAVVALSFALYSESAANSARINREAVATNDDTPPAAAMANLFLARLLYPSDPTGTNYGTTNDATIGSSALLNGIRGYDMATMVYGYHPLNQNTAAYNGIGTVSEDLTANPLMAPLLVPTAFDNRRHVVNYSWQQDLVTPANSRVFDPEHLGLRSNAALPPATSYVGRNAPYTYPDRNNLYLAVQDPATGKVLKVSFVSPHFGGLQPGNPNWTNAHGRYMTIRPRPFDHTFNAGDGRGAVTDFPAVPLDPDGIARGDVQNIPTTDGIQQHDAVWTNVGLPVVQWRGKNIIPLIAPTILALDGKVNANVAGNLKGSGGGHGSTNGFGPWEINLARVLNNSVADAASMVNTRYSGSATPTAPPPSPRGMTTTPYNYAFPTSPQAAGLVDWNATATQKPYYPGDPADPETNTVKSNISFPSAGAPFATPYIPSQYGEAGEGDSHPGSFNPYSWNAFTSRGGKLFSYSDLRRSSLKFSSARPGEYASPYFGTTAPASLVGSGIGSPSNTARALVTTTSNSLARARLGPNFRDYTSQYRTVTYTGGVLGVAYDPNPVLAAPDQFLQIPFASPPNGTPATAWASDYSGSAAATTIDTYKAVYAALGAVDVNRPLADYRVVTTLSLADYANPASTPMVTPLARQNQITQATAERAQLAREIFARLILSVGAKAQVLNGTTINLPVETPPMSGMYTLTVAGVPYPVQAPEYEALRYLAQIAVNIVDYVDSDDVITPFNWNPADPNAVVLGVEKPRLVLNEAYSEIINDPATATGPFQVKFWVELLNTSNTDVANSPLAGPAGSPPGSVPLQLNGGAVYQIEVYDQGANAVTQMASNPTGDASGATAKIRVNATTLTNANPLFAQWVEPNNGRLAATAGNRNGIAVVGPRAPASAPATIYNPTNPTLLTGDGNPANANPSSDLFYTSNFGPASPTSRNNTILLRRLMNPYLPHDPTNNPYVTVDYMTNVYAEEGVRLVQGGMTPTMPNPTPPTGIAQRRSIGRVQPYCGREVIGATPQRVGAFPQSLVVPQRNASNTTPGLSLFQHNSSVNLAPPGTVAPRPDPQQQLLQPFEWLVHLDRPLINQTELLHVAGCRNHDVTHAFATPNAGGPPLFHQHTSYATTLTGTSTVPLYRALELLAVKPWGYGLPDGGRVPGKVNINMIWDQKVLEALLDQNGASSFNGTDVTRMFYTATPTQPLPSTPPFQFSLLFGTDAAPPPGGPTNTYIRSPARTKDTTNKIPGSTVDEVDPLVTTVEDTRDRPFKPFGAPTFNAGGNLPSGSGLGDTLLRMDPNTNNPAIFSLATHPYQKAEMLRKMYNSITTTSDTYLVVMTVGYFEVRNGGPYTTGNPPVLGREVFDEVPTDLRAKFVAVVDRSMLAIDNPNTVTGNQVDGVWMSGINEAPYDPTVQYGAAAGLYYVRFPAQGFDSTANKILVAYEGRTVAVGAGDSIVLGNGASQEVLTISSLGGFLPYAYNGVGPPPTAPTPTVAYDSATGLATVQIQQPPPPGPPTPPAPPAKAHVAGSLIANAILGNPGPQPNFDVNQPRYKGVVPFFDRVTIGQ